MVPGDVGTNGGEGTKPVLSNVNLAEDKPVPIAESSMEQHTPMTIGTTPFKWLTRIPEIDKKRANVKDSITFGLLARGYGEGVEASGSSGCLAMLEFKFTWGHVAEDGSTDDVGKTALMPPKVEKGELLMGPMVTFGWKSKDYLVPIEESVLLVGKSTGMPETTLGDFASQTARVG